MDYIHVRDMQFYGYHGVLAAENMIGQRFRVTVAMAVDLQIAGESDALHHTVNYAEVYEACQAIVEGQPYKLIEALAHTIATTILTRFSLVKGVQVEVIKPDPPIAGHYKEVAVSITRGEFV